MKVFKNNFGFIPAAIVFGAGLICIVASLSSCAQTVVQGPPGPQGKTGQNGASIVSTTTPDVSGSCANGGNVILMAQDTDGTGVYAPNDSDQSSLLVCNGLNGSAGATGATGPTGPQGNPGTNATPVSVVQFCSGYTTTYPSSFPEFGIVISGSIYAVYWTGSSAWLAEVVPGYYASTSTSAPCDFTVNSNGTVTTN